MVPQTCPTRRPARNRPGQTAKYGCLTSPSSLLFYSNDGRAAVGGFELGAFDLPAFVNTDINKDFTENWSQIVDGIEGFARLTLGLPGRWRDQRLHDRRPSTSCRRANR
jgi:hypothetical protein